MNNRQDTISHILHSHPDAFIIFSNGLTAREAVHFHPQERCFYMLHAMGESLSVGYGLASCRPELEVVVVDGDYNAIMGMSSWSMLPLNNLSYYILRNGSSETTGGQTIPEFPAIPEWCNVIDVTPGKADTPNPPEPKDIVSASDRWLAHTLLTESKPS